MIVLSGCSQTKSVLMTVDSICELPKREWSIHDTYETIRQADAYNAGVDKRCGKGK